MKGSDALALGVGLGGAAIIAGKVCDSWPFTWNDVLSAAQHAVIVSRRKDDPEAFDAWTVKCVTQNGLFFNAFDGLDHVTRLNHLNHTLNLHLTGEEHGRILAKLPLVVDLSPQPWSVFNRMWSQNNPDEFDRFVMNCVRDEWRLNAWTLSTGEVWDNFFRSHGIAISDVERQRIEQKLVVEFWNSTSPLTVNLDSLKRVNGGSLPRARARRTGGKKKTNFQQNAPPDAVAQSPADAVEHSASLFLKELRKSNSALTNLTAMREVKRLIKPLIPSEFSRPTKLKKKKIASTPALARMVVLYNQQAAIQLGCSIEEAGALKDVTRVEFKHWARIVRTEIPDADAPTILAVRTAVHAMRRSKVCPKPKKRKG